MEDHWKFNQPKFVGGRWERKDGVIVYRPSKRSHFRAHRPNVVGYGFEDLTGPKGTALTFKTADAAAAAADHEWPLQ